MIDKYSKIEKLLLAQGKFYISLELDRIKQVLSLFGNPQDKLKIIHVAGTNGKGSVCAILSEILIKNGYKTGTYTSPHLVKYNERIKINNEDISDDEFYKTVLKITKIAKENSIHLTEFEILTAVMYSYFYENSVDIAVVEVGLGGRFDATNCIKNPLVSVITSISKDHTERLGDTVEKIAFEKAGIIKKSVPVIFDKNNLGKSVFEKKAKELNSQIYYSKPCKIDYTDGKNILLYENKNYEFNLLGKYQEQNAGLVFSAIDVLKNNGFKIEEKCIITALKTAEWKGRFQYIKNKNIILDGCHNPDGAKVLHESLDYYFGDKRKIFIYTSLKNKDYKEIQKNLFRKEDKVYHFYSGEQNFIQSDDVKQSIASIGIDEVKKIIEDKNRKDLLIICGSLYALGNILGKIDLCS